MAKNKKTTKKTYTRNSTSHSFYFPSRLLSPVASFLKDSLKSLQSRKKDISSEDPFKNSGRAVDNASPDADAAEQFGHARTSALREQLDRKIVQTKKALTMIKLGSYGICEDCGKMIDTDRLTIYPEATLCVKCERKREK